MKLLPRIKENVEAFTVGFDVLPAVCVVHNLQTLSAEYMNKWGLRLLNITLDELRAMGPDYHNHFFNQEESAEYVPKILGLLERNNNEEVVSFFQQVKVNGRTDWTMWLSSVKIFMRDEAGLPLLTVSTSVPVDTEHNFSLKVVRLIEENNFLRHNKQYYASLTKREIEMLELMAKGKSGMEIAEQLSLSEDTVKTHRRNIKRKISADSYYDVVKFAQAFDML